MATWSDLDEELNAWEAEGRHPIFWWRDDDADRPTPALDRLIALAEAHGVPLHLSVVPAEVGPALAERLDPAREVEVIQHGFAHVNHDPPGARASEVAVNRALEAQLADIAEGWRRLEAAGLPNLLPVFCPPWNRIAEDTVAALPRLGFRMLSAGNPRTAPRTAQGLVQVNTRYDPIRWKDGARFRGDVGTLKTLVFHLRQRRLGEADPAEPTGLTTHHLAHDEEVWDFTDRLLSHLSRRGIGEWVRLSSFLDPA